MARELREAFDELDDILSRSTSRFAQILSQIALAEARFDQPAVDIAESKLGNLISASQAIADMFGRKRLLLELEQAERQEARRIPDRRLPQITLAAPRGRTPLIPDLTIDQALKFIAKGDPRLALLISAIKKAYTREQGVAVARASSEKVKRSVREKIRRSIAEGKGVPSEFKLKEEIAGLSRSHADTVFRTNINAAYAAGRFQQSGEPEFRNVIGGLRFRTARDDRVRPNHRAAEGLIASPADPVWDRLSPPLGFNCRCTLEHVTWQELGRKRLTVQIGATTAVRVARVPRGAVADRGFGVTRTDLAFYSS